MLLPPCWFVALFTLEWKLRKTKHEQDLQFQTTLLFKIVEIYIFYQLWIYSRMHRNKSKILLWSGVSDFLVVHLSVLSNRHHTREMFRPFHVFVSHVLSHLNLIVPSKRNISDISSSIFFHWWHLSFWL